MITTTLPLTLLGIAKHTQTESLYTMTHTFSHVTHPTLRLLLEGSAPAPTRPLLTRMVDYTESEMLLDALNAEVLDAVFDMREQIVHEAKEAMRVHNLTAALDALRRFWGKEG